MNRIKEFLLIIWYFISYPFTRRKDKERQKKLKEIAEEDLNSRYTERDVEILRSIGIETDLETLRKGGKKDDGKKK